MTIKFIPHIAALCHISNRFHDRSCYQRLRRRFFTSLPLESVLMNGSGKSPTQNSNDEFPSARVDRIRYDLSRGHPNDGLLPTTEMRSVLSALLEETPVGESSSQHITGSDGWHALARSLNYGHNAGDERLLSALQSFLNRRCSNDDTRSVVEAPLSTINNKLFITGGVSHGLELICSTHTQPGDEVWVERPTYFLAPKIFESHGLVIRPLPMMSDLLHTQQERTQEVDGAERIEQPSEEDNVGQIDVNRLINMVEQDEVPPPKMIYIIPSYQNPTGRCMPLSERTKLASFVIKHGVILVADEVYHLLDWEQSGTPLLKNSNETFRRPARMSCFNNLRPSMGEVASGKSNSHETPSGFFVSVSSFTKIFAPGIRLGWIEGPPSVIERLCRYGYINSQGGVAPFMGRIMARAIESGTVDSYLDKLKSSYAERYHMACSLLEKEPRLTILSRNPLVRRGGGYFLWVQFPLSVDSSKFLEFSIQRFGVKFMPGVRCDPFHLEKDDSGALIRSSARLCFVDLDRDVLKTAIMKLLEAFDSFMELE